jgi:AcrR family transcriptional regulator
MTREVILAAAREVFATDAHAAIGRIVRAAGTSRATFYRHFRSRSELVAALELEPDRSSRERVLGAAAELIGRDGLADLSMDELADRAGVSRATVYRLYPGKAALFEALVQKHTPFGEVVDMVGRAGDQPPELVLPEVLRLVATNAVPQLGLLRAMFSEVAASSPDALSGAGSAVGAFMSALGGYLERQMALGRLRSMHPALAVQVAVGPLLFHLLTRQTAERLTRMGVPLDTAVEAFAEAGLRALRQADAPHAEAAIPDAAGRPFFGPRRRSALGETEEDSR